MKNWLQLVLRQAFAIERAHLICLSSENSSSNSCPKILSHHIPVAVGSHHCIMKLLITL